MQQAKTSLDANETEKYDREAKQTLLVDSLRQKVDTLTREKRLLEAQLEAERMKLEAAAKKYQSLLAETLAAKEQQQLQQQVQQQQQQQQQQQRSGDADAGGLRRGSSVHENMQHGAAAGGETSSGSNINVLESLQSKLKLRDGDVHQMQRELQNLERIRESMAREMVNLANKLDEQRELSKEYPQLQEKYNVSSIGKQNKQMVN